MYTEDVEAIRKRMMSLLVDAQTMRRKTAQLGPGKSARSRDAHSSITLAADSIDLAVRELYHLLPEHLRPADLPPLRGSREKGTGSSDGRTNPGPRPGGRIPRSVRWPNWTIEQILHLADDYWERHGKWPNKGSGKLNQTSPDTWNGIDVALNSGNRGLPGGTTLAMLLAQQRGVYSRAARVRKLSIEQILEWADEHFARTGAWPKSKSGAVVSAPSETWIAINNCLRLGTRGLGTRISLAQMLATQRGAQYHLGQVPLTEAQILSWADAHHDRTGQWPTRKPGEIPEAPNEDWMRVNTALIAGARSLPGGSSLARLLAKHRGVKNRKGAAPLKVDKVLKWADVYFKRHSKWPTHISGPVEGGPPGETWGAIDAAFKASRRGLADSGFLSLHDLLVAKKGKIAKHGSKRRVRGSSEPTDQSP